MSNAEQTKPVASLTFMTLETRTGETIFMNVWAYRYSQLHICLDPCILCNTSELSISSK